MKLLLAQARTEQAAILSRDSVFEKYPVHLVW